MLEALPVSASRTRVLAIFFAFTALALGALAAIEAPQTLWLCAVVLTAVVVAWTVPLEALASVAAALVPIQLYFFIPGTDFAAPAAFVFVVVAGLRVLLTRGIRGQVWIVPAAVFLGSAFIAALTATSRYGAFRGIYEWLPIFACVFIAAQTVNSARMVERITLVLVVLGTAQAGIGLLEYVAGMDRVVAALASPLSELFYPPNLLRERLVDLSFNWNANGRALPFGTFINEIDYAIFLAAIIMLALTRAFSAVRRAHIAAWLGTAFVMGAALVLTLKGSGWIAFVAGAAVIAVFYAPRFSRAMWLGVIVLGALALLAALPFADTILQRAAFLFEREQNLYGTSGRLRIWSDLLNAFTQRPWFGFGFNNAIYLTEPARTLRNGVFGLNSTAPESAYVSALVETGAIGFIALMSLFGWTFVRALSPSPAERGRVEVGALAALVAIWAGNLSVSAFTTEQNGMLMGLLIGIIFSKWNQA